MIDKILNLIGYSQKWHIVFLARIPGREDSYGDGVYTITPRLTEHSVVEMRKRLAQVMSEAAGVVVIPQQISILGLTRIPK